MVQAYAFGKYLGYLKVTFDDAGKVVKAAGNPILLDSSVPQGRPICCAENIIVYAWVCLISSSSSAFFTCIPTLRSRHPG